MLPSLEPTVAGKEAVRRNYENTFQHVQVHTAIQEGVQMSPEWAYVRTDSAGTFTPVRLERARQQPSMNSSSFGRRAMENGERKDVPRLQMQTLTLARNHGDRPSEKAERAAENMEDEEWKSQAGVTFPDCTGVKG